MILRWLPWRLIIKKAAKAYGTVDPLSLLARLRRFSQPSEVQEPIELIRAGIIFHARGLINTKAIQHNLDWVWPYWVNRQFNPRDNSFIPRAFSFSHINLTHRNWTGVGIMDDDHYPIIDPRGLVTPFYDGWSVDFWLLLANGKMIVPSRERQCRQTLELDPEPAVVTEFEKHGAGLTSRVGLKRENEKELDLSMQVTVNAPPGSRLILSVRPYNPEGVQIIEKIRYDPESARIKVDKEPGLTLPTAPEKMIFSDYDRGDVFHRLEKQPREKSVSCRVGMATAAAVFKTGEEEAKFRFSQPMPTENSPADIKFSELISTSAKLNTPEEKINFLFRASEYTLLLLSARDFVPGPYTYKRFWFRDACLMLHALIKLGHTQRSMRILSEFPKRQKPTGFYHSQQGEWDSNGQVLWIISRLSRLSDRDIPHELLRSAVRGAKWIKRKRLSLRRNDPVSGLFPAGFSAEHLGPNDYYYWDNFWALSGLREIAPVLERAGFPKEGAAAKNQALELEECIHKSLEFAMQRLNREILPASPFRRMDAGAVGSLAADYPLQLRPAGDTAVLNTIDYLQKNCFYDGAFFQEMIHSGQNPYLSLCIAQGLLRNQGHGHEPLVRKVADLASSTGTWPEAVHPRTGGGCMGDGHHGWAAAEWILMLANMFVREENGFLILGSGVFPEWFDSGQKFSFGPTPTEHGNISVIFEPAEDSWYLRIKGQQPILADKCKVRVPGFKPEIVSREKKELRIKLHRS